PRKKIAFVPYAGFDLDEYAQRTASRLAGMGIETESVHRWQGREAQLLDRVGAVFIGGGNTFRLLHRLYLFGLVQLLRERVRAGLAYIGSSAGSIVAGPTLKTTKDMPVAEPPSFGALHLVPYHISPHYLDPDPTSTHMGETQEERIGHFLEENDERVVGLREGSMIAVEENKSILKGEGNARLFRRGATPKEVPPGPLAW